MEATGIQHLKLCAHVSPFALTLHWRYNCEILVQLWLNCFGFLYPKIFFRTPMSWLQLNLKNRIILEVYLIRENMFLIHVSLRIRLVSFKFLNTICLIDGSIFQATHRKSSQSVLVNLVQFAFFSPPSFSFYYFI